MRVRPIFFVRRAAVAGWLPRKHERDSPLLACDGVHFFRVDLLLLRRLCFVGFLAVGICCAARV